MNVRFLTQGVDAPSSRYRVGQLIPYFAREGVHCSVSAAYGKGYNRVIGGRWALGYKMLCRLKGAVSAVGSVGFDLVVVQKMTLPYSGFPEELLSRRNSRLVFDFDDAVYLGSGGCDSWLRESAFRRILRASRWVVAGNTHLAEVAGVPEKTTVIPTTIDTENYVPGPPRAIGPVVVGWMGTSGNFPYLRRILPSVLQAVSETGARLRIVSNASLEEVEGHPCVEQVPWSAAREVSLLQSFDIGLMPLSDTEQARGKCAFKLIQYMAVGCPVVASSVGANVEVVGTSDAGVLVSASEVDWAPYLVRLIEDPELRARQGGAGRARCVSRYSAGYAAEQYLKVFRRVAFG